MAKLTTALKVRDWTIYTIQLSEKKEDAQKNRGLLIRATNRKSTIDLEIYNKLGERIKCKVGDFNEGVLIGGYDQNTIDSYNALIMSYKIKVRDYIEVNKHLNKDLLITHVYGADFVTKNQRKRTKYITIPVTHNGKILDSYNLESKEVKEILDRLISKQTIINEDGTKKVIEGFFDSETGESLVTGVDEVIELVAEAKSNEAYGKIEQAELKEILAMSPEQRYKEGKYNKEDIFECFAACWYPNPENGQEITSKVYQSVVLRLLQYKVKDKPSPLHNVKDFNEKWCTDFLSYLFKTGWVNINSKAIKNPFNFDYTLFKRTPTKYQTSTKIKHLKGFKGVVKALGKLKILPKVDLSNMSIKDFVVKEELQNDDKTPRNQQNLKKRELDHLLYFDFKDKIIDRVRDIFILQVVFGGLRINEYNPNNLSIEESGNGYNMVVFNTSHTQTFREVHNPLTPYSDYILAKYNGEIPFVIKDGDKNLDETLYNNSLKKMAQRAGIKRKVKGKMKGADNEMLSGKYEVFKLISSLWARKTMAEMLIQIGLIREEVMWFTGHTGKQEVLDHYLSQKFIDIKKKTELLTEHNFTPEL